MSNVFLFLGLTILTIYPALHSRIRKRWVSLKAMIKEFCTQLEAHLIRPKKIVIFPHRNPDGDALGSTLAWKHFLESLGHTCHVVSPNEHPNFLKWLPGQDDIILYSQEEAEAQKRICECDLLFTLDFNTLSRIYPIDEYLAGINTPMIMIDHHESPADYPVLTYSDPSIGSTCEMVYEVMKTLAPEKINATIGTCIYTGIMTDTGSFRFPSTTERTHQIAAEIIALGVKHSEIHQNIYDSYRTERLQLLGKTLNNLVQVEPLKAVYTSLSQEELNACNFQKGDTEGFVNYGLSIEGIRLAVILIENQQEKRIKMSFRSKGDFDVNQFARNHFNGGGHKNAAGGMSQTSLEETIDKLHTTLLTYKEELT